MGRAGHDLVFSHCDLPKPWASRPFDLERRFVHPVLGSEAKTDTEALCWLSELPIEAIRRTCTTWLQNQEGRTELPGCCERCADGRVIDGAKIACCVVPAPTLESPCAFQGALNVNREATRSYRSRPCYPLSIHTVLLWQEARHQIRRKQILNDPCASRCSHSSHALRPCRSDYTASVATTPHRPQ